MTKWSYRTGIALWLIILMIPFYILLSFLHPGTPHKDAEIFVPYTGNTTRIMGDNPTGMSLKISRIKYPTADYYSRPNFVVVLDNEPLSALPSASLLAPPLRSVLLISGGTGDKDMIIEEVKRLSPTGINGYQVIIIGNFPGDYIDSIVEEGLNVKVIASEDPQGLSLQIDKFKNNFIEKKSKNILVASADKWKNLLPGLAWSVRSGDSIFFIKDNKIPEGLKQKAGQEKNKLKIFYFGELDKDMEEKLNKLGEIDILSNPDPAVLSANFAQYYNQTSGLGWYNRASEGDANLNVILTDAEWYNALLGASLNSSDKFGPLLITDTQRLSPAAENFLWSKKPLFWATPAEGPYNHAWIIGNQISYSVQARIDYINEIAPYLTGDEQGLSGLEALLLAHILVCFFGSLWTALHIRMRKPGMFWGTRIMWPLLVSVTGCIGLLIYILSYKNRKPVFTGNGKITWIRPVWNQAAFATAGSLAFGASLMAAFDFLWYVRGIPVLQLKSPLFWLGNPMIIQMVLSYIAALAINLLLFQSVMNSRKKDIPYSRALNKTLLPVFISMTTMFLGMMPVMWWLQMKYLPVMPEADTLLWWGTLLISILAGTLLSYIANWEMVRLNLKEGNG